MNHWMFKCDEVSRLVSESMDRHVTFKERLGIRTHLMMCRLCRRHKNQLQFIRDLMAAYRRHLEQDVASIRLSNEARFRIKQTLRSQAYGVEE